MKITLAGHGGGNHKRKIIKEDLGLKNKLSGVCTHTQWDIIQP